MHGLAESFALPLRNQDAQPFIELAMARGNMYRNT